MTQATWKTTGRLDMDGDPVFEAPDGCLWSVRRSVGYLREILERLRGGTTPPWSDMERLGHSDDWVVAVRWTGAGEDAQWEALVDWTQEQLVSLGEKVRYHDWERQRGALFRGRLDEDRARLIGAALEGHAELEVQVVPVLAHMQSE